MQTKLVVWGASGHALVIADMIRLGNQYDIIGFLDDINIERHQTNFAGAIVIGGREQLSTLHNQNIRSLIIAVGDCNRRLQLANIALNQGFQLVSVIHPRAIVAPNVVYGPGTVIMAGAVINPGCRLGANVIINTGAIVDHECLIEDGVHISPGAHLGGNVHIGRATWIGIGAAIKDKITIGAHSVIGAGAVVVHHMPSNIIAYGVPAVVHKEHTLDS